jgi:hypothetical protein
MAVSLLESRGRERHGRVFCLHRVRSRTRASLPLAVCISAALSAGTALGAVPAYALVGSFPVPSTTWDVLADGRVIAVGADGVVRAQGAPNAGTYSAVGSVDPAIFDGAFGNFGASFLRVNPDSTRLAIGDNGAFNRVHFVSIGALNTSTPTPTTFIAAPNQEAAWADSSTLYVTGFGSGSIVSRLDTTTSTSTPVINVIGDGSGGVAIRSGRLFTGIGLDSAVGAPSVGLIRSFNLSALASATSPVAFATGTSVADALTAGSLDFDAQGNLTVGGGDFFGGSGDFGYAAVYDADAIAAALAGGPLAPSSSRQQLSPAGVDYYSTRFNAATNELLIGTSTTIYRFAIPAPSAAAMIGTLGVFAARRRR